MNPPICWTRKKKNNTKYVICETPKKKIPVAERTRSKSKKKTKKL